MNSSFTRNQQARDGLHVLINLVIYPEEVSVTPDESSVLNFSNGEPVQTTKKCFTYMSNKISAVKKIDVFR